MWILGDCPPEINAGAPPTFGPGCVALVYGVTPEGDPPAEWFNSLAAALDLGPAAQATLCMRNVEAFCWTAFWDSSGQATPLEPRIAPVY